MSFTIAFAGKGGTGKTSLAAITIRYLREKRKKPVLAVDADSNNCLDEALGLDVRATIGKLREESMLAVRSGGGRPGGMSMEELFDYQVQQSIVESEGVDLMVMGRPEGPGCYCAANNIIRKYTDKFSESYSYVVIDNEAGMEHLSRRTTHGVDVLLIVSDATQRGIYTAQRINSLVDELKLDVASRALIINKVPEGEAEKLNAAAEGMGIKVAGAIPLDSNVSWHDLNGIPVVKILPESPALKALYAILDSLNIP
jgi:CO dehydrogenase maturation factor